MKNNSGVIWLTGISNSGKTTIAKELKKQLDILNIKSLHLDGDEIRDILSNHDYSKEGRKKFNLNVGKLASLFESQNNIVIVSLISPYKEVRNNIRKICKNFIEVYINTPLELCKERDIRNLYNTLTFEQLNSSYEIPDKPEIKLDGRKHYTILTKEIIDFIN